MLRVCLILPEPCWWFIGPLHMVSRVCGFLGCGRCSIRYSWWCIFPYGCAEVMCWQVPNGLKPVSDMEKELLCRILLWLFSLCWVYWVFWVTVLSALVSLWRYSSRGRWFHSMCLLIFRCNMFLIFMAYSLRQLLPFTWCWAVCSVLYGQMWFSLWLWQWQVLSLLLSVWIW